MKTKKKEKKGHPEAKGLLLICLSLLLFTSLISFVHLEPEVCFLGSAGYYSAFTLLYIFGLGSYLLTGFLFWVGLLSLLQKPRPALHPLFFGLFLFSICMNLTVIADSLSGGPAFLEKKIIQEKFVSFTPVAKNITRSNLGGVFFYFLYEDVPLISIKNILSGLGCFLFFSLTALTSFLLMTGLRITDLMRQTALLTKRLFFFFYQAGKKGGKKLTLAIAKIFRKKEKFDFFKEEKPTQLSFADLEKKLEIKNEKVNLKTKAGKVSSEAKKGGKVYDLPTFQDLTSAKKVDSPTLKKELGRQAKILEATFDSFGIEAKVGKINCGPTITSFEVHPSIGVKVQKIKALQNDIALNLQAKSIRIIAPIPGKKAVGIEIPSIFPQEVSFKDLLYEYHHIKKKPAIPVFLGKTVSGESVITDLAKMPHCLIAGATGSGKSVCINSIVMSILMTSTPEQVKLIMIDPKKVELTQYSKLPHMIAPVITEAHGAYAALQWLVKEMQNRYEILKQLGLRNISAFNSRKVDKEIEESLSLEIPEEMYRIVAIVDEFADLMMVSSSDLETPIARIAQMARAVGIHLILATQRPSREVITGIIKANFPCRIAFKVSSRINSQIILDETGAESLLGNGDLLFLPPGSSQLIRAQGAFISDHDINTTLDKILRKAHANYLIPSFDAMQSLGDTSDSAKPQDALYDQALQTVLDTRNASTTFLQRKLKIGYARAASLIDALEENNIIGPQEGGKGRRILVKNDTEE
jgi:S-DNA-T family DNA segregation ATPase FtsK/SpoIIIE